MTPATTPRTLGEVAAATRRGLSREPGLTALGCAGLVIALASLIAVGVRGSFIPPEGKMADAATFTFGVAVFTLTMALLLPLAGFSERGRRRWRRTSYVFPVFGFVLEPLQAFRGLDPRFTEAGGGVDVIAGIVFGGTAAMATILFVILAVRFFRDDVLSDRPVLRAGIRYGVAAVAVSFGLGIVMSVVGGREVGEAGDLILSHGLGVHGIQAVPLVALLMMWAGDSPRRSTWLHAAGVGWLAAVTATAAQGLSGQPVDLSPLTIIAVIGLLAWVVGGLYAVVAWRGAPQLPESPAT